MNPFRNLNELLFPVRCIGCGILDLTLCSKCRRDWNPHRLVTHLGANERDQLKITSSVRYSTVAQKIILAAKESHIKEADLLVAEAIRHSLLNILREEYIDVVIPIPSRRSAARLRGRQFIEEIAHLAVSDLSLPVLPIIGHSRNVRDQSGLTIAQRRNNLEGALVVEKNQGSYGRALVIDDLVTTGATLMEATRALRYAGIEVIGAVTAALAQPVR